MVACLACLLRNDFREQVSRRVRVCISSRCYWLWEWLSNCRRLSRVRASGGSERHYLLNKRNVYVSCIIGGMGIVKISDQMHEDLRVASSALCRSINAQAEHWMRIGMLAELHPELGHNELSQWLIRAELAGGFDLASAAQPREPGLARQATHSTRRVA